MVSAILHLLKWNTLYNCCTNISTNSWCSITTVHLWQLHFLVEFKKSCGCHEKDEDKEKHQRKAIIKLLIAIGLGTAFMTGEAIGKQCA